jgi:hypothetical protein
MAMVTLFQPVLADVQLTPRVSALPELGLLCDFLPRSGIDVGVWIGSMAIDIMYRWLGPQKPSIPVQVCPPSVLLKAPGS